MSDFYKAVREIAEYLYKYENWDYRCALAEAEKRVKRMKK